MCSFPVLNTCCSELKQLAVSLITLKKSFFVFNNKNTLNREKTSNREKTVKHSCDTTICGGDGNLAYFSYFMY